MGRSNCFLCDDKIYSQLRFNRSTATTEKVKLLSNWRQQWTEALCRLLGIAQKDFGLFASGPYCIPCHELIANVEFMTSTISRFQNQLRITTKKLRSLLIKKYSKSSVIPQIDDALRQLTLTWLNLGDDEEDVDLKLTEDRPCFASNSKIEEIKSLSRKNKIASPKEILEQQCIKIEQNNAVVRSDCEPRQEEIEDLTFYDPLNIDIASDTHTTLVEENPLNSNRIIFLVQKPVIGNNSQPKPRVEIPVLCNYESCAGKGRIFSKMSLLQSHVQTIHNCSDLDTLYHCLQCPEKYSTFGALRNHESRRHATNHEPCPICTKPVLGGNILRQHIVECHPPVTTLPSCTFCKKTFEFIEEAEAHEHLHASAQFPFACVLCSTIFSNTYDLQKHVWATHEPSIFKCEQCDQVFVSQRKLGNHKRLRHNKFHGTHSCPHCLFHGTSPSVLKAHMYKHGEKTFKCEIGDCGRTYFRRLTLNRHQRISHGMATTYVKCTHCPKTFINLSLLKAHQIHHSTIRSFMCEICSSTFKSDLNLKTHMKVHERMSGRTNVKLQKPRKARLKDYRFSSKTEQNHQ